MKKVLLGLVIIFILSAATCFAAPFNKLEPGQTAIGLTYWGGEDDQYTTITGEDYTLGGGYLEHRFDNMTLGFEILGRSDTGITYVSGLGWYSLEEKLRLSDFYLHYHLSDKFRLLLGRHSFEDKLSDNYGNSAKLSDNKVYVGASYSVPLSDSIDAYAALTTASIQVGANVNLSDSVVANLFYRTFDWDDQGVDSTVSGFGLGVAYKF